MMDAGTKKKGSKGDFEGAIKGNEEIRNMRYHFMTFEELEDSLETNISESKFKRDQNENKFVYRERIDSRPGD
jgi:hypothetical protein